MWQDIKHQNKSHIPQRVFAQSYVDMCLPQYQLEAKDAGCCISSTGFGSAIALSVFHAGFRVIIDQCMGKMKQQHKCVDEP